MVTASAKNILELSDTFSISEIMNLRTKRCFQFLGIGGVSGLAALTAFLFLSGVLLSKASPLYTFITTLFDNINKPLEWIPCLEFLAERQDPVLSIGFMAAYWATLGILLGALAFAVFARRWKTSSTTTH